MHLIPIPIPFPSHGWSYSHSHGNPVGPMGSQSSPFPCTPLLRSRSSWQKYPVGIGGGKHLTTISFFKWGMEAVRLLSRRLWQLRNDDCYRSSLSTCGYRAYQWSKIRFWSRFVWCQWIIWRKTLYDTIRYDTRCYFNVRSKANMSQLNLPHGTNN